MTEERYKQVYSKYRRLEGGERMKYKRLDLDEAAQVRSESFSEDEDDETCGIFCFGLGLILMFVGVAILATVIVYNQSEQSHRPVLALTSTRQVRPVSQELTDVLRNPTTLVPLTDFQHGPLSLGKKLSLLVVIHSLPKSSNLRTSIRDTWMPHRETDSDIVVFFSVPAKGLSEKALTSLREESHAYKDMVIFTQSSSTPESELLLFEWVWAVKTFNFHYLLKVRDTMYVNLPLLMTDIVEELKERKSNAYLGYFEGNKDPKDNHKLNEPDWYLCDHFIRYAHSGGYIISEVLVKRLLHQAEYLHPYNNEDIALATWLSPFNDINWIHETRFDTEIGNPRGCKNSNLIFQIESNADMVVVHHRFIQNGQYCEVESENIPTYKYNFNALPSQCCTPL